MVKKSTISFRQDMLDLVLAGEKTVTIRPINPQPKQVIMLGSNQGSWLTANAPYEAKQIVSVRENKKVKLNLLNVDMERLHDVSNDTWRKDGLQCFDRSSIMKHWNSFYGYTKFFYVINPWVWVVEFELTRIAR